MAATALAASVVPGWGAATRVVSITEQPPERWAHREAVFRFTSRTKATSCRRDRLRYRPCRSKVKYSGLRPGKHTFTLRARYRGRTVFQTVRWTVLKTSRRSAAAQAPEPGVNAPTIARRPDTGAASSRTLLFNEEFNGPAIDPAVWSPFNSRGNFGIGLRRPEALSLDGRGNLLITARMAGGRIVSGGMAHATNFTYGRVVFRVKTEPDPTGTMSGVVLTWPQKQWAPEFTENDMYETGPHKNNRSAFSTFIHFGPTMKWQKWTTNEVDPSQWHTIAMEWYPRLMEIFVDGQLSLSISDPAVIPDNPQHVNVQLDPLARRKLTRRVRMWVDYIRVYQ